MVDIHCHLLAGLDDGPDTIEESLRMAQIAIADGITHVVCTPHASDRYKFDEERVRKHREELQEKVGKRLVVATGCDFHMSFDNLQDLYKHPAKYTLNQKDYLLVEFADFAIPAAMDDALHQLQIAGLRPIITHPERNGLLCANPARLDGWLRRGCYAQVTALSFLGRFGQSAQRAAEQWLDEGRVHFVASDAHNASSRPIKLKEAYAVVAKRRGETVAKALFCDNPLAAFEGRPLPYVPELPEKPSKAPPKSRKKKFWFF
jgi:protein-tyrosine phosphatase